MNPKWIALAADLLETASNEFARHGCNDLDFPDGWTVEERRDFVRAMEEDNGTPEAFDPDYDTLMDWAAMDFLAGRLKAMATDLPATTPEWMVILAMRYALGRQTSVVGEACDWLVLNWGRLPPRAQHVIKVDVEQRFREDEAIRATPGEQYARPLGMDMDRRQWERVRALWADKPEGGEPR